MRVLAVPFAILLLSACTTPGETCDATESAAVAIVRAATSADQPCTVDEDCEAVAVAGSCFDACSDVIAVATHDAYTAAIAQAEADVCVDYGGCTLIAPPCMASNPVCGTDGMCTDG